MTSSTEKQKKILNDVIKKKQKKILIYVINRKTKENP